MDSIFCRIQNPRFLDSGILVRFYFAPLYSFSALYFLHFIFVESNPR
ncbi:MULTISPECIES: hypothetical protein [unclassified Helicobacter]|nr:MULTISPECIES: hypothetical protein [unclassified Helicobacter]